MFFLVILLFSIESVLSECPPGTTYIQQMNICLAIVQNGTRYGEFEALTDCRAIGGDLTSIHNGFGNTLIFAYILENGFTGNAYIGGHRKNGQWLWTDGSNMTYTNWVPGNPTERDDCMEMSKENGKWTTADCNERNVSYFCSIPYNTCPSGWILWNDNCYFLKDTNLIQVSWEFGDGYCRDLGAHLPSIHSKEENDFISNITPKHCSCTFIGLQWNNGFSWTDGTPVTFNNATTFSAAAPVYFLAPSCLNESRDESWLNALRTLPNFAYYIICKQKQPGRNWGEIEE